MRSRECLNALNPHKTATVVLQHCRSFSKMNNDRELLRRAMADDVVDCLRSRVDLSNLLNFRDYLYLLFIDDCCLTSQETCIVADTVCQVSLSPLRLCLNLSKDCSSVNTFKGVSTILKTCEPMAFILENVDTMDSNATGDDEKE